MEKKSIAIPVQGVRLGSELALPRNAKGAVLFSHGRGSGLLSARNRYVAHALQQKGLATLLVDLLTREEDAESEQPSDVTLLTQRLLSVTRWAMNYTPLAGLNIGLFGCSTGAASALKAAAKLGPGAVKAVVSAGGRPDLAGDVLSRVRSPTLLVVGGLDVMVLQLNKAALTELNCTKKSAGDIRCLAPFRGGGDPGYGNRALLAVVPEIPVPGADGNRKGFYAIATGSRFARTKAATSSHFFVFNSSFLRHHPRRAIVIPWFI